MKTRVFFATFVVVLVSTLSLAALAASTAPAAKTAATGDQFAETAATEPPSPESLDPARVERGRYLVSSIGCDDCHTPKVMGEHGPEFDSTRHLIGHPQDSNFPPAPAPPAGSPWIAVASWDLTAWSGPWGTSYAANLTPDVNTGLGIWTEEMFVRALRTGRHMGQSRPILPPMPWQVYRNLSDEDLGAIYTYLRTIPPVHNRVPQPLPPPGQEPPDPFAR